MAEIDFHHHRMNFWNTIINQDLNPKFNYNYSFIIKPDGEGQIPYDLTFNWNIINRKKRKQNITRDIEVKNNLTMDRGEWGGDSEERGLQGIIIYYSNKGHMDKIKEEGGSGGGTGRKATQL